MNETTVAAVQEVFKASTDPSWGIFLNLGIISIALVLATFIRSKVKFFQKFMIPNALTAGILLIPFYNYFFPMMGDYIKSIQLEQMTYHFLSLSFIAIILRKNSGKMKRDRTTLISTSVGILSQISMQCFLGLIATYALIKSGLFSNLYHSFGILLPLGYSQGPGQAFAIGSSWPEMATEAVANGTADPSVNLSLLDSASSIGLTFAAMGFIICCFGGIFLINYGIKRGWLSKEELKNLDSKESRTGIYSRDSKLESGSYLTTQTEAIDSLTIHIALVVVCYALSYLLLKVVGIGLTAALGNTGAELATSFWGINYIFAVITAFAVKSILKVTKVDHIIDNSTMTRITGFSVDTMVTCAIAAISIATVADYWVPFLIIAILGGITTYFTALWLCSRMFKDHIFLRTLLIFGCSTGTLSTGLALLRVLDPKFETPVAEDYTLSASITFALIIPVIIIVIPGPVKAFITGDMSTWWMSFSILLFYMASCFIYALVVGRKKLASNKKRLFANR